MNFENKRRICPDALHEFVASILEAAGLDHSAAAVVADALVQADLRGAVSHGVIRLPFLVARLTDGGANPAPDIRVMTEAPAVGVVDADGALGPVAATYGMKLAMTKAATSGIGAVTVRNSDFIGTCAHSAMLALDSGMIGMTWTNGFPGMAPWGGRANGIGNNPVAYAIPGGRSGPVVLDIAMSVVAGGKVRHAAKTGQTVPQGWIVDADGRDTERPEDLPDGGALLSLGHKGYGLAIVGEALTGVLSGAAILGEVPQWFTATDRRVGNGHFHLAIDPARFIAPAEFAARMDEMADRLKSVPLRPGVDEILLPGEGAARRAAENRQVGIAVPDEVLTDLSALGHRFRIAARGVTDI